MPGFAKTAHPLHVLTKKDVEFYWRTECQVAFEQLKLKLTGSPVWPTPSLIDALWWKQMLVGLDGGCIVLISGRW